MEDDTTGVRDTASSADADGSSRPHTCGEGLATTLVGELDVMDPLRETFDFGATSAVAAMARSHLDVLRPFSEVIDTRWVMGSIADTAGLFQDTELAAQANSLATALVGELDVMDPLRETFDFGATSAVAAMARSHLDVLRPFSEVIDTRWVMGSIADTAGLIRPSDTTSARDGGPRFVHAEVVGEGALAVPIGAELLRANSVGDLGLWARRGVSVSSAVALLAFFATHPPYVDPVLRAVSLWLLLRWLFKQAS